MIGVQEQGLRRDPASTPHHKHAGTSLGRLIKRAHCPPGQGIENSCMPALLMSGVYMSLSVSAMLISFTSHLSNLQEEIIHLVPQLILSLTH